MINRDSSELPRESPLGRWDEGHEVELNCQASDWRWYTSVPPELMGGDWYTGAQAMTKARVCHLATFPGIRREV